MTRAGQWRDRVVLGSGLLVVAGLGWVVLGRMSAVMAGAMPGAPDAAGLGLAVLMWLAMMVAMMAPATAPVVFAYITLARRRYPAQSTLAGGTAFCAGYLLVWIGYAVLAAFAQWLLSNAVALLAARANGGLSAAVLIAAGSYQLTPLKRACMVRCRSPLLQLMMGWHDGAGGALRLGLVQGSWCVGCCWMLMVLMFVVGVMSLIWMVLLALFILVEKLTPAHWRLDLAAGTLLIVAGGWSLLAAIG